jgi:deoxyguanosine kinase
MLIGIEGCIGAGKTTLLHFLSQIYPCHPLYEEPEENPFLEDFYREAEKRPVSRHMLYTSLFLQERQLRQILPLAEQGKLVVTDFHPLKNLILAKALLPACDQALLTEVYDSLSLPVPYLMIYLKADEEVLLARLRKKKHSDLPYPDFTFITQLRSAYEAFFRTYPNRFVTIDTSRLDYFERKQDINVPLDTLQEALGGLPSLKVRAVGEV